MNAPPIYGLILAGGASSRMRRDKAALPYRGATQLDRAFALASRHVPQVFVSVRAGQTDEPTRANKPLIVDSVAGEGPIVGVRSAFAAYPDVAWLVIACDLPFLSNAALEQLLRQRDCGRMATAFASAHDGLPEPLCAIWEPGAAPALAAYQESGGRCPRKFLGLHSIRLLEPEDRGALDNVNTPEEYAAARQRLEPDRGAASRPLKVQYFAVLREQAGRSEELLESAAATPAALFAELAARHRFTLVQSQLKVAVNSDFAEWTRPLQAGDSIVFIPPVAGG